MFVRRKKNKSGVISVQVIDKSTGKYKLIKTIGSSSDGLEIEKLIKHANQWIKDYTGVLELDFSDELKTTNQILDGIEQLAKTFQREVFTLHRHSHAVCCCKGIDCDKT